MSKYEIQAAVLAIVYGRSVAVPDVGSHRGFVVLTGIFLWTSNAIAYAAEADLTSVPTFM